MVYPENSRVSPRISLRRPLQCVGLLLIAGSLAWVGWSQGRAKHVTPTMEQDPLSNNFVVSGSSMAPTLRGPSLAAICPHCDLDWILDSTALEIDSDQRLCSHCGSPLQLGDPSRNGEQHRLESDVVQVHQIGDSVAMVRGDLVAVKHNDAGAPFVKRVVGLPGDTVNIDNDQMHLTVNGRRAEDLIVQERGEDSLPRFIVDSDNSRPESRWSASQSGAWKRDAERRWLPLSGGKPTWLIYGHQSVYDQNRSSPVLDDYQYNVSVARKLQPVDRFSLSGHCLCVGTAKIDVAFWSSQRSVLATVQTKSNQNFETSYYHGKDGDDLPVGERQPVAIRVNGKSVVLSSLVIKRWVEYRLRPSDAREPYPRRINNAQYFLLGDNVPLSEDSREFGLITFEKILGIVSKR